MYSSTKNEKEDKNNVITHNNELNDKQAENNGLYGSDKEFLQQQFNFIKRHSNSMAIKPFQCCNKNSEEIYINDSIKSNNNTRNTNSNSFHNLDNKNVKKETKDSKTLKSFS